MPYDDLKKFPYTFWVFLIRRIIYRIGDMTLPFLIPYLLYHRGFTAESTAWVVSSTALCSLLIAPISGYLSDYLNPRWVVCASLVGAGCFVIGLPRMQTPLECSFVVALRAMANEISRPAGNFVLLSTCDAEDKILALSLNRMAINLGAAIGPLVGSLVAQVSFNALFIINAITSIVAGGLVLIGKSHQYRVAPSQPNQDLKTPLKSSFRSNYNFFLIFLLFILPGTLAYCFQEKLLPIHLVENIGLSLKTYGAMFTVNAVLILVFEVPLNIRLKTWLFSRRLALGFALFSVGFATMAIANSWLLVSLSVVVWTFGEITLFNSELAYVIDIAPHGMQGRYLAIYFAMLNITLFFAPWLIIALYNVTNERLSWILASAAAALSASLMIYLKEPSQILNK